MKLLKVKICRVQDVADGDIKVFAVPGLADSVLVTNIAGQLFAMNSTCPHDDVSLGRGRLNGKQIVCPGHRYSFDLVTGFCTHDSRMRLVSYTVDVVDGDVFISLQPKRGSQ